MSKLVDAFRAIVSGTGTLSILTSFLYSLAMKDMIGQEASVILACALPGVFALAYILILIPIDAFRINLDKLEKGLI